MREKSSGSVRVTYPTFSRDELIADLRQRVGLLADVLPLRRVTLFGSWAAGRATAFSDIDLLVIYLDPPRSDAYRRVREGIPLRGLEPHVYAASEEVGLEATLARMTAGGVELWQRLDEE